MARGAVVLPTRVSHVQNVEPKSENGPCRAENDGLSRQRNAWRAAGPDPSLSISHFSPAQAINVDTPCTHMDTLSPINNIATPLTWSFFFFPLRVGRCVLLQLRHVEGEDVADVAAAAVLLGVAVLVRDN